MMSMSMMMMMMMMMMMIVMMMTTRHHARETVVRGGVGWGGRNLQGVDEEGRDKERSDKELISRQIHTFCFETEERRERKNKEKMETGSTKGWILFDLRAEIWLKNHIEDCLYGRHCLQTYRPCPGSITISMQITTAGNE